MSKPRLTRQSWIDAALEALVAHGPSALAAEPLARRLGATKGSFYWHFKDVPALHEAVSKDWQARALAVVAAALADDAPADERLRRFGQSLLADRQDPAMRGWARINPMVSDIVAEVDAERMTYIGALLSQLGITNRAFAQTSLGSLVGMPQLPGAATPAAAFDTLVDMVVALR
ncbi:TetR/AcrR family transcriptional regulator [Sulfitobacter sp. D35]|uniref:TetR/AcrR family transcriptional regulator n=1 Tax=Sulfitobacter sp. D35 TaxID=3083252 RepID=UPI00296E5565|nr:TetR/AcrR family transcriptional regulator [Sulfitobacter sp. D35]MDW4500523.1 TetR/AcrR family transcriptional regulator [Sulfitobacter sp. D35]